ncbi:unnamed protein product [Heterotrigona itama]|uniref:SH3 domain-containing protein n=1 Tax=Heterotrigona itama TaxID=395501 RepID=A0A6V7HHC8_9HYME|nr:unnamed protein product [Heterotrigona itama]
MTQERRRYGFVLERQCSLAKHYASFHEVALAALHPSVDKWREVAATREYLPQSVEDMFASRLRQVSFWPEDEENGGSELTMSSQLRKTRSMDSSCLELRPGPPSGNVPSATYQGPTSHLSSVLSRARSEANLHASTLSLDPVGSRLFGVMLTLQTLRGDGECENTTPQSFLFQPKPMVEYVSNESTSRLEHVTNACNTIGWRKVPETPPRPRSMAPPASRNSGSGGGGGSGTGVSSGGWGDAPLARALFAYLSSGENQLSFLEGDLIALMGDRQKGWQFGENLRTQSSGWFPLAYTEIIIDDSLGSPNHGTNNGRVSEPQAVPPCKPPPSRPPVTPSIDEVSSGFHGIGSNNVNNSNNNNTGTPTNVPNSNSSHNLATPTARQTKPIRPSGTLPTVLAGGRRIQPPAPPVPPPQVVTSLHSSNDSGFSNEPPAQPDIDYSDDEAMRQRRRKPRADRITETAKQHQKEDKSGGKDWENDSWKTIPRDEKSWHLYRTAMDIWAETNASQGNENGESRYQSRRYDTQERKNGRGGGDFSERGTMENGPSGRKSAKKTQERSQKNEYDNRGRGNNSGQKNKATSNEEQSARKSTRRSNESVEQARRESSKRTTKEQQEETEEDEIELEEEEEEEDEEEDTYSRRIDYQKYEGKKYYGDRADGQDRNTRGRGYRAIAQEESKYENEKTSTATSSGTDDESTITIPETGRKVEHIAQKLEQTAQKYAREHSPPKNRGAQRFERERERYLEKSPTTTTTIITNTTTTNTTAVAHQKITASTYERERAFEKNPDRNRNIERASSRRFERPRPPSEEAPQRPTDPRNLYRERRYSDKEEAIYGETRYVRESGSSIDKERGYESNFETKLERTKVIERHGYQNLGQSNLHKFQRNGPQHAEKNDTNNNTLKGDNRKPLLPRQTTAVAHLIQTGRAFDVQESKSPKLVKRTKSFWRFRRDSDVLEGMALWQHRSLVDIPKMIKKEAKDEANADDASKKQTPEGSPGSRQSLEKRNSDVTITNESHHEEPKPAERIHVPEKSDYFEDFPTPAERPKTVERSEYRMHQEERSYFMGNVSRKAIIEKERKRSLEAKRNMIVAELKENNEAKRHERRKKYTDDEDGLTQNFSETEASDEESTYSCIVVKDQTVAEKTLLPRTKLRRDSDRERDKNTCGPWYDLWGVDASVNKKKKKKQQ